MDYRPTNFLYLDIETKSHGEPDFESLKTKEELRKDICKSKTDLYKEMSEKYKKEETILKHVEERLAKQEADLEDAYQKQIDDYDAEFRKKALNSLESDLVCISMAFNEGEPVVIEYDQDEKKMLQKAYEWIVDTLKQHRFDVCWVGINVIGFDLLRFHHRCIKYQLGDLAELLPMEKWSKRVEDLNDLFNAGVFRQYTSLDDMCVYLGIPGKGDVDGSKVHDLFLEGKLETIYDYCANGDVRKTRMIHRMLNYLPQLESDLKNVK